MRIYVELHKCLSHSVSVFHYFRDRALAACACYDLVHDATPSYTVS